MRVPSSLIVLIVVSSACQSPPPAAETHAPNEGFVIRSEDGKNELALGGLFQVTAGAFGSHRVPAADFALRRMRPEITGRFGDAMRYAIEPNFAEDGVELEEAWFGVEFGGGSSILRIGRMKAPFTLEEVRSRRHIDFTHFSIINQFAPAEDHGIFWSGKRPDGRWEYDLAAYNGTGGADTTSSKDVAGRVMMHPFAEQPGSRLQNLQVGIAATIGVQGQDVGGDAIENELGLPVVQFLPGLRLDGARTRLGLEFAWFDGPNFVQSEILVVSQDMEMAATDRRINFSGAYVTFSHVLTGESKSFGGVTPARPYSMGGKGGGGAWVLAARLSELQLDDDLEDFGFAAPGTFTDRIRTASVGLNWIPNANAIVRMGLIYSDYSDHVKLDSGRASDELGLLIETQLHF